MKAKKTTKAPMYLRASGWKTWQACALSLTLKDVTPFPPEQDEFAAEGTAIHAAIEADLIAGRPIDAKRFDPETEALVDFAVRVTRTEAAGERIHTEVSASTKVKAVGIGGTADAVIHGKTSLTVIDFKTGWKKVEAEGNEQLKIYAHLNAKPGQTEWRGVIINARLNNISNTGPHALDPKYLSGLAADAVARVKAKQTQVGNHCTYCPALAVCQPVRVAIKKWLTPGADDGIKNRKDDWAEMLNIIKPAENLFKRIKSDALKYTELGGELPGVSVEYSGGSRAWPRDLSPAALADRLGVKVETLTNTYLISPSEAEKAGVSRDKIQAVAVQPMRRGLKISTPKKDSK